MHLAVFNLRVAGLRIADGRYVLVFFNPQSEAIKDLSQSAYND
jgi:hypothetical protein